MREVCKVRRKFKRVLKEDIQRREKATGSNIEGLLEARRFKGGVVPPCSVVSSCMGEPGPTHQEGPVSRVGGYGRNIQMMATREAQGTHIGTSGGGQQLCINVRGGQTGGAGDEGWESGRPVGNESRGPAGVAKGG